ncbi:permease-like cell division protein FtsX [Sulfuriferula nivalis]|uniref:Cell division protein FtsX n=1 Tax=Sulfuriferula nivalis TaxID=2675298 RepID=A0A809RN14_9PROT|nr:permease-like cell division protein FtsX [Sulfuriferula nivalis]BBP02164.1 cell division protein FtsX [Sulfuriferula nivalis]
MKTWLIHHRLAIMATLKQMWGTPLASLLTLFAIGITLSLPTGMLVILNNASEIAANLPNPNEISVYMDVHSNGAKLKAQLSALPNVAHVEFIPKQTALTQIGQQLNLGQLINELPQNPLPDAWIITPANNDIDSIKNLISQLEKLPDVNLVQSDHIWSQRLDALLKLGQNMLMLLAGILAFALIAITSNTIHLQISTRHAEIEVSQLIGATDRYIRRPFLYFGTIQGLLGGIIAWLIVFICIQLLTPQLVALGKLYDTHLLIHVLTPTDSLLLLALSAAMGWIGAYFAVSRSLANIRKFA